MYLLCGAVHSIFQNENCWIYRIQYGITLLDSTRFAQTLSALRKRAKPLFQLINNDEYNMTLPYSHPPHTLENIRKFYRIVLKIESHRMPELPGKEEDLMPWT